MDDQRERRRAALRSVLEVLRMPDMRALIPYGAESAVVVALDDDRVCDVMERIKTVHGGSACIVLTKGDALDIICLAPLSMEDLATLTCEPADRVDIAAEADMRMLVEYLRLRGGITMISPNYEMQLLDRPEDLGVPV